MHDGKSLLVKKMDDKDLGNTHLPFIYSDRHPGHRQNISTVDSIIQIPDSFHHSL